MNNTSGNQNQKNNQDNDAIRRYDIFYFMGASDLPEDERQELLQKMQNLIINDFLFNDLPKHLTENQMSSIENYIKQGYSEEEISQELQEMLPNYADILYEKSIEFKKVFIINELRNKLKKLKNLKNPDETARIEATLNCYEDGKWAKGVEIINA